MAEAAITQEDVADVQKDLNSVHRVCFSGYFYVDVEATDGAEAIAIAQKHVTQGKPISAVCSSSVIAITRREATIVSG